MAVQPIKGKPLQSETNRARSDQRDPSTNTWTVRETENVLESAFEVMS